MEPTYANLTVLYRGFSAAFAAGFGQAAADHQPLAMEVRSQTSREEYPWLGQAPSMREWFGERTRDQIQSHGYSIRNRSYESTIEVPRTAIEDDQYGAHAPRFTELGRASAAHPAQLVYGLLRDGWDTLCYDGQALFDTDHPVDGESVSNTDSLADGGAPLVPGRLQPDDPAGGLPAAGGRHAGPHGPAEGPARVRGGRLRVRQQGRAATSDAACGS